MIKTLRITSIIAVVLAAGLFAFPIVFGFRSDAEIERFLSSPTAIDRFQAKDDKADASEGQVSPLVEQAKIFALIINPPKPLVPPKQQVLGPVVQQTIPEAPPPPVAPIISTAKFKVVATSFHESRPDMSLVLIDEPGKGLHWVRQGANVSHIIIEQIRDGSIVARGGERTYELGVEPRPPRKSLVMGSSPMPTGSGGQTIPSSFPIPAEPTTGSLPEADAGTTATAVPQVSAEQMALMMEKVVGGLKGVPSDVATDKVDFDRSPENVALIMEKLIGSLGTTQRGAESEKDGVERSGQKVPAPAERLLSDIEATRVGDEEAEKLGHLGQELEEVQEDADQTSARIDRREEIRLRIAERRKKLAERRERLMERVKEQRQ